MKSIFAIFDRKTNSVELVKDADNIQAFERWFVTVFLRSDGMFALYPDDYDIYELCALNPETLEVNADHPSTLICSVSELFDIFKIARPNLARDPDEA